MGCSGPRVLWIVYNLGCGSNFCFSSPSQFSSSTPPNILTTIYYLDDIIITMSSSYNTVPIAQVPFSEVSVFFCHFGPLLLILFLHSRPLFFVGNSPLSWTLPSPCFR